MAGFLGHRDELARAHAPALGVVPMQHGLHGVDAVIGETELRLVQQLELPARDARP